MRVFVLGAGASKSYAQSPTGQRMPVARDFFQTYEALDIAAHPWVLVEGLIGYLQEHRGVHDVLTYLRSGVDIEALHSEIEQERDSLMAAGDLIDAFHPFRAYNELIFLFTAVLNEIQNGPVSAPHLNLARLLEPQDVVVTFNWDTLLDRALAEVTAWRPDWGYGLTPRAIYREEWVEPAGLGNGVGPSLIKLHGSTNWLTGYTVTDGNGSFVHSHELDPSAFAVFERSSGPYPCFAGRYMGPRQPYAYGYYPPNLLNFPGRRVEEGYMLASVRPRAIWKPEGEAPDHGLVSMPLLIPPVRHKSYEFFGEMFRTLWRRAEDAIAAADEIVLIGYSFPATDRQSDQLFRAGLMRRTNIPKVCVLDPAPERIVDKFAIEFGVSGERLTVDKSYFSETYDLAGLLRAVREPGT